VRRSKRLARTLGTPLGPDEILSAIGAGGMGEVYKARDTKLKRDVAIKDCRIAERKGLQPLDSLTVSGQLFSGWPW
jgi:hypothetical protein